MNLLPVAAIAGIAGLVYALSGGSKEAKASEPKPKPRASAKPTPVKSGDALRLTFRFDEPMTRDERREFAFQFTSANAAAFNQIFDPSWNVGGDEYQVTVRYRSAAVLPLHGRMNVGQYDPILTDIRRVTIADDSESDEPVPVPVTPDDDDDVVSPPPEPPPEKRSREPSEPEGPDPGDIAARISRAIKNGPDDMVAVADWLDSIGESDSADMLRTRAAELEEAMSAPPPPPPPPPEPEPEPEPAPAPKPAPREPKPLPAPEPEPPPEHPLREAAQTFTKYMRAIVDKYGVAQGRWKVNRDIVKEYQRIAGQEQDGAYGVNTALSVAETGIVPVTPMLYSSSTHREDKQRFVDAMKEYAQQDPQRSAQWHKAYEGIWSL